MMLAMVNLILSPKVRTRTPRFNVMGLSNPKFFPKESQERPEIPAVIWAIKLPRTMPAKSSKKSAHAFFPVLAIFNTPSEYNESVI